jgi:hypothetical protein
MGMEADRPDETTPGPSPDTVAALTSSPMNAFESRNASLDSENEHRVWHAARELGSGGPGLASLGQGTVATLAGFDLASVVLLSIGHTSGWAQQAAVACLGIAAAMLVLALAFIANAEEYSATPDERLIYYPEARISEKELNTQRGLQRQDAFLFSVYCNERVLRTVNLGVLFTLTGLALAVFTIGTTPGPMIAAAAAIFVGVIYLVDWWKKGSNWWLFPRPLLPAWTKEQWDAAHPDQVGLTRKQQKKLQRDEWLHCARPSGQMTPEGRAAMLQDPQAKE